MNRIASIQIVVSMCNHIVMISLNMNRHVPLLLILSLFLTQTTFASDSPTHSIKSFSQAKRILGKIYKDNKQTFYCGCTYNNKKRIDLNSCGYKPRKNKKRAKRLEWEHVVPAYHFGNPRTCWREKICTKKNGKKYKGRRCCNKIDQIGRASCRERV